MRKEDVMTQWVSFADLKRQVSSEEELAHHEFDGAETVPWGS